MTPWSAKSVKIELVKAFRVLGTVPVKDRGVSSGQGFWPTYYYEADEIKEQQQAETTRNRRPSRRYTPREIQRMEHVLLGQGNRKGWLCRFLGDEPGARRCLASFAQWSAQEREIKRECKVRGFAYSTFRRKYDKAAQIIADALNQAREELP